MNEALDKIVADLLIMRKQEAAGVMVFANSDDTMFEDCIRRLKELSTHHPEDDAQDAMRYRAIRNGLVKKGFFGDLVARQGIYHTAAQFDDDIDKCIQPQNSSEAK